MSESNRDDAIAMAEKDLRRLLAEACAKAGGQSAFARKTGVSQSQVSQALSGDRSVTEAMVIGCGFMPVTRYMPIRKRVTVPDGAKRTNFVDAEKKEAGNDRSR